MGASMSAGEWNQPKIQPEPDQRDDKLLEDQVVGFLSLVHIRHTECWAQRALSTFAAVVVRNDKGQTNIQ